MAYADFETPAVRIYLSVDMGSEICSPYFKGNGH